MRDISVPVLVDVPRQTNTTDLVVRQAAKPSNPALFAVKDASGEWENITATEFRRQVEDLAKGLIA